MPAERLEANKEFAEKSQALLSVPPISASFTSLSLPRISPHILQTNFDVDGDDSVFVMMRKSYPKLKQEIENLEPRHLGICVQGPVGVGKSYLLYLLATEYRMNRERYRVTYINDCAMWECNPYRFLLRELVTTFHDDIIEEKSIVEWCQEIEESEKKEKLLKLIESLAICTRDKFIWVCIFDQHNALFEHTSTVETFPFNLVGKLTSYSYSGVKVVISASANNEEYMKLDGWVTHGIGSYCFDQDEYKVWCEHYLLKDGTQVDPESDEAGDAYFWTGGVPYELKLLWNQKGEGLIEKTMLYCKERFRDFMESHAIFCGKLSDREMFNLKECISRMVLGLSPPGGIEGMDCQLIVIFKDVNGKKMINALNPVSRRVLLEFHGQDLFEFLNRDAGQVLRGRA